MTTQIHPDMQLTIAAHDEMAVSTDPEERRRSWREYAVATSTPMPERIEAYDRTIPTPDREVPVRIYRPAGVDHDLPCVIFMHGGGFMLGDLDTSDTTAWGGCDGTAACVVSIDYRLTPEDPFPAAFDDCYGVLVWLAAHGPEVGIDPTAIAVSGDSAGGNLSAALCLAVRDRQGPAIRAQAIVYPGMAETTATGSYIEHAVTPTLTAEGALHYSDLYTSGSLHADNPYASPTKATDLSGLPPALVQVAELDPIRDDGRLYAAKLALAGSDVIFHESRGMSHGFLRARLLGEYAQAEFAVVTEFLTRELNH